MGEQQASIRSGLGVEPHRNIFDQERDVANELTLAPPINEQQPIFDTATVHESTASDVGIACPQKYLNMCFAT